MEIKQAKISIPELGLIAGTRGLLGIGVGFLLADRISRDRRQAIGWTLLSIGVVTTIPLALEVWRQRVPAEEREGFKRAA